MAQYYAESHCSECHIIALNAECSYTERRGAVNVSLGF
jgi:hypothetical protein